MPVQPEQDEESYDPLYRIQLTGPGSLTRLRDTKGQHINRASGGVRSIIGKLHNNN